ncbi:hypothetical protein ACFLT9_07430, partial [Acidobacteriota bacterium]
MNERVRITVSGIRGEVPEALNSEVVSRFTSAFATYLDGGKVALCHDTRATGRMLAMAAFSSISAAGLNCSDFGLLPTPFLQYVMAREGYSGGLAVTGGHNPLPWNAVILLNEHGTYLENTEGSEVFNVYESGTFKKVGWENLGRVDRIKFPFERYLDELARLVDRDLIRQRKFKVVADPCNGALSPFLKDFAESFGIDMIPINNNPGIPFSHAPEPNAENASQAEAVVKATGADMGFLLNSDGSRLSLVDESGQSLNEELTLPLCLISMKDRIRKAVTTLSTSSLTDWAAERNGISLVKTRVGQSAVVNTMEAEDAEIGGEGSGSFCLRQFSQGYDALLALVLILDLMSKEDTSLSELISGFPVFF